MKRSTLSLLMVVLTASVALLFFGCGQAQPTATTAQPEEVRQVREPVAPGLTVVDHGVGDWEIGKRGGRMVMGQLGEGPRTFNFILAAETSTTDITDLLGSGLVTRNQFTLEYQPHMAESYEISADEKTITVRLLPDLKWSDGTAITSRDWVDGMNKVIFNEDVQTNMRDAYFIGGEYATFTYIDDRTFSVTVAEVYAALPNLLGRPFPMHILGPLLDSQGAEGVNTLWGIDTDVTQVVSSGPFVIASYSPGERITLRRNPNYFMRDAAGTQLPYLDELVMVFTPDQDTLLQNFLARQTDMLGVRGADYASLVNQQEALGFKIYEVGESTNTNFITMNQNPETMESPKIDWLMNRQFRTALAHLIDRETLINNLEFGFGYPQYSFVPRFSPYYWEGADEAAPKYDPVRAAEILDSIGFVDQNGDGFRQDDKGNPISLVIETNAGNRTREGIITIFAQEAENIGLRITPRPIDFNVLVGKLLTPEPWDLILIGLTGSVDPISGANVYPSRGNLHMVEPRQESPRQDWQRRVDEAWIVANQTTNEDQRKRGFQTIQEIWIEELPWAYTFTPLVMTAYAERFGNIYPQPIAGFDWKGIITRIYEK